MNTIITFFREHLSLLLVLGIFLMILIVGWKYITVGVLAASLAVVVLPLHRKFTKKIPAPLSATIITTFIFVILAGICASVIVVFKNNMAFFIEMLYSIVEFVINIFHIPAMGDVSDILSTIAGTIAGSFSSMVFDVVENVTVIVFGFVLFYACMYLFIIFGDTIVADICDVIPEKSRSSIHMMAEKTKGILFSIYVVHVSMAVLVFLLALLYASILGYGHVVFIAMLCGVAALIPMVGAVIVLVFIALYAISIGDWFGLIITATLGYFLLCILIDFILRPKLTAKRVKVRPMLMFVGFFGGGATMGLIGFILGPVFLVLGLTGYEVFFKEMRDMKKAEMESAGPTPQLQESDGEK